MALLIGKPVPDVSLPGVFEGEIREFRLAQHRGRWLVAFFYARDFTGVCGSEVREFERRFGEFADLGIDLLGISVDSVDSHREWLAQLGGLRYPLLSDVDGGLARAWEILTPEGDKSLRASFIIDPEGVLRFQMVHVTQVAPSVGEILRFAQALQSGELCPADWQPGRETLGEAA